MAWPSVEDDERYVVDDEGVVHDTDAGHRRCRIGRPSSSVTEDDPYPTLAEAQATGAEPCHWCLR